MDRRRIFIFLGFAFGIAWLTGLVLYLTGGLAHSIQIAPGITLALILLSTFYMWAPAFGNIFTRLITKEGWTDVGLRPHFRKGWPFWLIAWVLPAILTVFGAVVYFLLFPQHYDSSLPVLKNMLAKSPTLGSMGVWTVALLQFVQGVLLSPIINSIATFGEEFGWRGYLLPKLLPLGGRKAVLWIGLIWGIWHWPIIFMGYEYGFSYPGYPWLGPLLFIWITFCFGVILAWLTLRGKSIWPAVIGHAAINGIAALASLAQTGQPNPLLGPLPVGIIGSIGYGLVALFIFFSPRALEK